MTLSHIERNSAVAVTDYLTKARDWLATAVENTGPEQIAAAKAEIATAAEATKQLGLSREIQEDAEEMVRRAEYALRKALNNAQADGFVSSRADGAAVRDGTFPPGEEKVSPKSFFNSSNEYEGASAMGALTREEFDEVIEEAKAEGNLSRANVARKAREKSGRSTSAPASASDDAALALINDIRGPWTRGITKSARLMSPKARAHLIDALDNTLNQLRSI